MIKTAKRKVLRLGRAKTLTKGDVVGNILEADFTVYRGMA